MSHQAGGGLLIVCADHGITLPSPPPQVLVSTERYMYILAKANYVYITSCILLLLDYDSKGVFMKATSVQLASQVQQVVMTLVRGELKFTQAHKESSREVVNVYITEQGFTESHIVAMLTFKPYAHHSNVVLLTVYHLLLCHPSPKINHLLQFDNSHCYLRDYVYTNPHRTMHTSYLLWRV